MNSEQLDEITRIYEKQKANRWKIAQTTAKQRIAKLKKLQKVLWERREEAKQAVNADFGKHGAETELTEILPTIAEIKHAIKHLGHWMKPKRASTPIHLLGTWSQYRYEPKGMVLILSPWNYPINLLINPLVAAVAAGNAAIIKPSSKVPNTSRFLKSFFLSVFPEEEVALFEGSSAVADALLDFKFDHIFFTGSTRIGKTVMAKAAKHLTPVTLELGGKSPAIIDETADLQKAAERLMWGKFINAGQTCVAPDYVVIHEVRLPVFLDRCKQALEKSYGPSVDERKNSESFCRIVSQGSATHLEKLLRDSVEQGAKIEFGGAADAEGRYLEPTILSGVTENSPIMQEEVFGPILPIMTYRKLEEPLRLIQSKSKPLALYIYSQDKSNIEYILENTTSGGTCVNTNVIHLAHPDLPFGGVGQSGMGNYHGFSGFKTFSHQRAVLTQGKFDPIKRLYPPYTPTVQKLIQLATRHLT